MKLNIRAHVIGHLIPAAFRRLCVETGIDIILITQMPPAAFRRLCVETIFPKH